MIIVFLDSRPVQHIHVLTQWVQHDEASVSQPEQGLGLNASLLCGYGGGLIRHDFAQGQDGCRELAASWVAEEQMEWPVITIYPSPNKAHTLAAK